MNFRHYYKSGDLIRYYDFSSRDSKDHKPRPAMVLGYNKKNDSVYAVRITSKDGRTEQANYELTGDEVRVPKGIRYRDKELYGVIKTNNVIELDREKITSTLDVFPEQTKLEVLEKYDKFRYKKWYNDFFEYTGLDCQNIVDRYKENLVAEKLGFFYCPKNNENIYEFVKDKHLGIDKIQKLETRGNLHVYSVVFNLNGTEYEYNIGTNKPEHQIWREWGRSKKIRDWLREDVKYHALMKRYSSKIRPDPLPDASKYKTFSEFRDMLINRDFSKKKNLDSRGKGSD